MIYNYRKLIVFSIVVLLMIIGTIISANGIEPQSTEVTLSMTLTPPLNFNYAENSMSLNRLGTTHTFSSVQEAWEMSPMEITCEDNWQLELTASHYGYMVNKDDGTPTTNPLVFHLYSDKIYRSYNTPLYASEWMEGEDDTVNSIMIENLENLPGATYTYYPQCEIIVTGDDPSGDYEGDVTWTLSPAMIIG